MSIKLKRRRVVSPALRRYFTFDLKSKSLVKKKKGIAVSNLVATDKADPIPEWIILL